MPPVPPPRAPGCRPVRSRIGTCHGYTLGTCGSSGCGTPPSGHCTPPAASSGRARIPDTSGPPHQALPTGHACPEHSESGQRTLRFRCAARLLRGAGGWNTLAALSVLPLAFGVALVWQPTWVPPVVPVRAPASLAKLWWLWYLAGIHLAWRGRQRWEAQYPFTTPKCGLQVPAERFPSAGTDFPMGDISTRLELPSCPMHGPLERRVVFLIPVSWRHSTPQSCSATDGCLQCSRATSLRAGDNTF